MRYYEDSIAFLGQWGRFQKVVFVLLSASIVPNGFGAFNLVFLTDVPSHHCRVRDVNLTEDWQKNIIPFKVVDGKPELSRCSRYRLDVVRNLSAQGLLPDKDVNLTDLEQEACVDGWIYNTDIYLATIVSEFDLVCDDEWKQPFSASVFFLGSLCGSFMSGQLSDKFGRKPVLFATIILQTICTFAQVYSTSWLMFTILLFINGLGQISNFVAALVLGAEVLTDKVRVLYSSLGTCFGFALGYMMLPLFAYFIRDWRYLLLALSVVGTAYLPAWWLIPESPRWLLSQGRVKEAEAIVKKAAKWNKLQTPAIIFEESCYNETKTDVKEKYNVLDLLKNQARGTTLIVSLVSFTITAGYYGLSFDTPQLHTNPFVSCFISAAVEFPSYVSSWLALLYLPRRLSVMGSLFIGAVPLFLLQLVPHDLSYLSLSLEMLGKYGFTSGLSMMFAYTAELYPTPLRNTATGTTGTVSRLGSCIAPFMLKMRLWFKYLPYILLGTLSILSAFAAFFLPETFGQHLPENFEQMQRGKGMKCPCVNGGKKNRTRRVPKQSNIAYSV
ncbi:solute carrier family 22 member 4-like [Solea solea]|uniref:solute carrier family 22 member 4-like n=1 Tax=Solea solea TaxID=90069 RepID=UPI002729DE20|nr:solute carrier family 22 member 4-like [Solea solea]